MVAIFMTLIESIRKVFELVYLELIIWIRLVGFSYLNSFIWISLFESVVQLFEFSLATI